MSVAALLLAPAARDLFSAAIIESGPPTGRPGIDPYAANTLEQAFVMGRKVVQKLGCSSHAGHNLLGCLRAVDATRLGNLSVWSPKSTGISLTIDGVVLPDAPLELFQSGRFHTVPLLIGCNKDEAFNLFDLPFNSSMDDTTRAVKELLGPSTTMTEAADSLRMYWLGSNYSSPWNAFDALSDDFIVGCLTRELASLVSSHGMPVFLYLFTHPGGLRPDLYPTSRFSTHTAEIPYQLPTIHSQQQSRSSQKE